MSKLSEIQSWLVDRLPELLAEHKVPAAAAAAMTVRQLLSHTAGFEGG